jgi:hypothetical protein
MRSLVLAVLAVGCGSDPGTAPDAPPIRSCVVEDVLAADTAGVTVTSCGAIAVGDEAGRMAAHDCVLARVAANEGFTVLWNRQGIDSRVARAYAGVDRGTGYELRAYFYDGDPGGGGGDNHPLTTTMRCGGGLTAITPCSTTELESSLCITCAQSHLLGQCSPF